MTTVIQNYLWYLPVADSHYYRFLIRALSYWSLAFALFYLGYIYIRLRLIVVCCALFSMPVLGLIIPLVPHTGDGPDEILSYFRGSLDWKSGEFLGTFPFRLLGLFVSNPSSWTPTSIARGLAALGLLGSFGTIFLIRNCIWPANIVSSLRQSQLIYSLSFASALLPTSLMYAGFVQTTYIVSLLFPWTLGLALIVIVPRPLNFFRIGLIIVAVLFICIATKAHLIAVVLLLPFVLSQAVLVLCPHLRIASVGLSPKQVRFHATAVMVLFWLAYYVVEQIQNGLVASYPRKASDLWARTFETGFDLRNFQTILHKMPAWVPIAGQEAPTCGQQSVFLTWDWLGLSIGALVHLSNIAAFLLAIYVLYRRIDWQFDIFDLFFIFVSISCIGFLFSFSPHFS